MLIWFQSRAPCHSPRSLFVHAVCQTLRILSFSSTQLPSPNYHCRLPELTAIKDMPLHWWGHFIVDLGRQASLLLWLPGSRVLIAATLHPCVLHSSHARQFHAFIVTFTSATTCHAEKSVQGQQVKMTAKHRGSKWACKGMFLACMAK